MVLFMIRLTLLTLLIAYLSVYAWKDWFKAACWLLLLITIIQHPDMPKNIGGIHGFNLWNVLFLNVVLSWLLNRKALNLSWDMPNHLNKLFFIYAFILIISVLRMLLDQSGSLSLGEYMPSFGPNTITYSLSEFIINSFKWVLLGAIIFDGSRTEEKLRFVLWILVIIYFLFSLQIIKSIGLGALKLDGVALQKLAHKLLSSNVGFHRVNLSMIISGAFWLVFCLKEFVSSQKFYFFILPLCLIIFVALALTGGRMGYISWIIVGSILCLLRWKKYFLLAPFVAIGISIIAPSVIERLATGVVGKNEQSLELAEADFANRDIDIYAITSGRTLAWPLVIESIGERPFLGYGRLGMKNATGLTLTMFHLYGVSDAFPHPHNAYLEFILDNGLLGALPVFLLFFLFLKYSLSLFKDNRNKLFIVVGGACASLLLSFLVSSFGSQSFYPREGSVPMWAMIGLMLRVYIERKKVDEGKVQSSFFNTN